MSQIIIIGDLHIKEHPLYKKAVFSFLDWLYEAYPDHILIQLGDMFNASSVHHTVVNEALQKIKKFKEVHIISGNHDQSKRLGNILTSWNNYKNISIYSDFKEVNISDHKCLMLPYQYNYQAYSELEGNYDFIFTHTTPKEESFGGDFVDLTLLKGIKIYGHIHNSRQEDNLHILGVPIISRNGEKNNPIMQIDTQGSISYITPPTFFDIQTINYEEEMENFNFLYNIKKAPSMKSVYEKYPAINIRAEGIEISYNKNDEDNIILSIDNDLASLYKTFCETAEVESAYIQEGVTAINECITN